MKVLSLFDGISCGQIALERVGIKIDEYYASEIKPKAIEVTQEHYPKTIQIGDVCKVSYKDGVLYTEKGQFEVGKIDLLIGGSPCQDFSCLKNTRWGEAKGYNGEKSKLFWEYLRILREVNPKYFLLENVKMKKVNEKQLNEYMKVVERTNVIVDDANSYSIAMNGLFSLLKGKIIMGGAEPIANEEYGYEYNPVFNICPDVNQICDVIKDIISRKDEIEDLGLKGRKFVEQYHDYIDIAQQYVDIFNSFN